MVVLVLGRMMEKRRSQLREYGRAKTKRKRDNNEDEGQQGTMMITRTASMRDGKNKNEGKGQR